MDRCILYLTNYYLEDVVEQRNCAPYISQAGQNKCSYMIRLFEEAKDRVIVWSNAWTNSKSFRFYRGFQSKLQNNVFYSDIMGAPFLNVWFCMHSCKQFVKKIQRTHKIDAIVCYNMRLENAFVALWAKKKWNIPIILQYEDGLTKDENVNGIKKILYCNMERRTIPMLDAAFLVNSKMTLECPTMVIRGVVTDESITSERENKEIPTILFAGSLDEQRGIRVLLKALEYTGEAFQLLISGRGELEDIVRDSKDSRVEYVGYLDYKTYKKVLSDADICINAQRENTSFSEYSFPSKISEYISNHKLVVSSNVADAKNVLDNLAFIYENDDPKLLAKKIEEAIGVWKDDTLYQIYQKRIQDYINENSIGNMGVQLNHFLDRVLGDH